MRTYSSRGSYCRIDDLNEFMGQFFTEFRQNLMKIPAQMGVGNPQFPREELEERLELQLTQMHDWVLRTQDLEV